MEGIVDLVWDCEANNLLNAETIDYTQVPYKLKPNFKLHCIVTDFYTPDGLHHLIAFYDGPKIELDGRPYPAEIEGFTSDLIDYDPIEYTHLPLSAFPRFVKRLPKGSKVRGHNIINFDLLLTKLWFDLDYEVETDMAMDAPLGCDTWAGVPVEFDDTLVRAKTLNPDRKEGQSLEALAKGLSEEKYSFRKDIPVFKRFEYFGPDMLYYNFKDCAANRQVVEKKLNVEMTLHGWNDRWNPAIKLEKAVAELITRQEHRGFKFDMTQAEKNIAELDILMAERKEKIEKIIPDRPATKSFMSDYTPPKIQFKKNGEPAAHMEKFAARLGATIEERKFIYEGKEYDLPLPEGQALKTTMKASINDTTHIKGWLITKGWKPSEYKEKDITLDPKKNKLPDDKRDKAIARWIEQTATTPFRIDRIEALGLKGIGEKTTEQTVIDTLTHFFDQRIAQDRGVKVVTNPSFTIGQEKEVCPNLVALAESDPELEFIADIVEYLTYRHRRNSILGGGAEWDEDEEPEKGYVSNVREDGRIPTPADTCGAATSRMKHRSVANVPRVTSLYGWEMRSQFGVDTNECYQIGYDFDSLEAREEAHFCWPFEKGAAKEYCQSLLMDKPNDVHTKMAARISEIIQREFGRQPAKNVKYGATYGAQAAKIAKTIGSDLSTGQMIFDAFWEAAEPLAKLKASLQEEWKKFNKTRIIGIDGRLIPTRSAHAILNSKFQSSGVICAKRAMVLHDRKMRAEGLIVDFFKDSLEGREWGQQLIAYHDEAQLEVSKKSVKFKRFETKEDAQVFKHDQQEKEGRIWSDIKDHPRGGVYTAYCRVGELAAISVSEVGRDYDMNVDLTAGYMVGNNWAMCH
tara:strand:- start:2850 stop:5417 length:2568 start_codon:yes stop_codon:yes gene_type:complete